MTTSRRQFFSVLGLCATTPVATYRHWAVREEMRRAMAAARQWVWRLATGDTIQIVLHIRRAR